MAEALADQPDDTSDERPGLKRAARVINTAVLAFEVFYLADFLTHGAVTRAVQPHLYRARTRVRGAIVRAREEHELQLAGRWVIFEAHEVLRAERDRQKGQAA